MNMRWLFLLHIQAREDGRCGRAVWIVVVVAFWYVTLRNLDRIIVRGRARRLVDALISVHSVVPVVWALSILTLIIIEFWWYWSTLG